jgi:hypothetical protein
VLALSRTMVREGVTDPQVADRGQRRPRVRRVESSYRPMLANSG